MADRSIVGAADQPAASIEDIIARHRAQEGSLLPILHDVQAAHGHISEPAMRTIAEALSLSRAEVHGVVSFYHDFRTAPGPVREILLCRAEACQSVGCEQLVHEACAALGVAIDAAEPGAPVALKTVYCLGNCALGPSALIDGVLRGRMTISALVAEAAAP